MNPKNPYENRWRWWYPAIADWMIANPGKPMTECAKEIGRGYVTICMIVNTDLFRDFLAKRRSDWEKRHDYALREKTTKVAESALDILADVLDKKRDSIPLAKLAEVGFGALDRLGYSPNKPAPAAQVNVNAPGGQVAVFPVSTDALQEAQSAIRLAQARRAQQASLNPSVAENTNECAVGEPFERDDLDLLIDIDPASGLPRAIAADN